MTSPDKHWIESLLDKPWRLNGQGPLEFDCWGLCVYVQAAHYQRACPVYDILNGNDLNLRTHIMDTAAQSLKWVRTPRPVDGCIVALSQSQRIHHVAVYVEADGGLVLHSQDGKGVSAQPLIALKAFGWNRIEFYQHRSWLPTS